MVGHGARGNPVNKRDEMLSLTDMWHAAREKHVQDGNDGDEFYTRRPVLWLASKDSRRLFEFLVLSLNVRNSDLLKTTKGVGGNTLAHWQIGLAYAKYLSPEFHIVHKEVTDAIREQRDSNAIVYPLWLHLSLENTLHAVSLAAGGIGFSICSSCIGISLVSGVRVYEERAASFL